MHEHLSSNKLPNGHTAKSKRINFIFDFVLVDSFRDRNALSAQISFEIIVGFGETVILKAG
jgi:hypothetical protein